MISPGAIWKSAWHGATEVGRKAASAVATTAHAVQSAAEWSTKQTVQAAKWPADKTVAGVKAGARAVVTVAEKTAQKVTAAGKWAAKETVAGAHATARAAKAVYQEAEREFQVIKAGAAFVGCAAENATVAGLAFGLTSILTRPAFKPVQDALYNWDRLKIAGQSAYDGHTIVGGCREKSGAGPQTGVLPPTCPRGLKDGKKITFVNGINTLFKVLGNDPFAADGICKTMQNIAKTNCAEVTGIYNAIEGIGQDLKESVDNIKKASKSPSAQTLRKAILENLRADPPNP